MTAWVGDIPTILHAPSQFLRRAYLNPSYCTPYPLVLLFIARTQSMAKEGEQVISYDTNQSSALWSVSQLNGKCIYTPPPFLEIYLSQSSSRCNPTQTKPNHPIQPDHSTRIRTQSLTAKSSYRYQRHNAGTYRSC